MFKGYSETGEFFSGQLPALEEILLDEGCKNVDVGLARFPGTQEKKKEKKNQQRLSGNKSLTTAMNIQTTLY